MAAMTSSRCPACSSPGQWLCSGCKIVKYCSVECQQADHPTHKVLCKSFKNFEQRPAENMRRIIYFPKDGKKPKFMWCPLLGDVVWVEMKLMDMKHLVVSHINYNCMTNQPLEYRIGIWYTRSFLEHYEYPNQAILAATDGKPGDSWRGPCYADCMFIEDGVARVEDMDMGAFAALVASLQDIGSAEHGARVGPKVNAVKLACEGEERLHGRPMFEAVKVPRHHPVFAPEAASSMISESADMPVNLYKYGNAKAPNFTESDDRRNQLATFMMCNIRMDETFGSAATTWDTDVGSVLVARKDRQFLDVVDAMAFASFCQHHLELFYHSQSQTQVESDAQKSAARAKLIAQLTPQRWSAYRVIWREEIQRTAAKEAGEDKGDVEGLGDILAGTGLSAGNSKKL